MGKTKWTPGPWETSLTDDTFVRSADNDIAVMIGDYNDDAASLTMTANANLISAAPDLYVATNFIDHFCLNQTEVSDGAMLTIPGPYIRALIDARRKARGE